MATSWLSAALSTISPIDTSDTDTPAKGQSTVTTNSGMLKQWQGQLTSLTKTIMDEVAPPPAASNAEHKVHATEQMREIEVQEYQQLDLLQLDNTVTLNEVEELSVQETSQFEEVQWDHMAALVSPDFTSLLSPPTVHEQPSPAESIKSNAEHELRSLRDDLRAYEEACDEMREQMDALETENAKLRQEQELQSNNSPQSTDQPSSSEDTPVVITEQTPNETQIQLDKALLDITRLTAHLQDLEQSHNDELISLSQEVDSAHLQLSAATAQIHDLQMSMNEQQMDDSVTAQLRDECRQLRISVDELEDRNSQLQSTIDTLRSVVDGYEVSKRQEMDLVVGSLKNQLSSLKTQLFETQSLLQQSKEFQEGVGMSLQEVNDLKSKCKDQETAIEMMQKQVGNLSTALSSSIPAADQSPLSLLHSPRYNRSVTDVIDKRVVASMLVQYFSTQANTQDSADTIDSRRQDILRLMVNMLDLSDEEKEKMGMSKDSTGQWVRRASTSVKSLPPTQSLTDAWMSFLLNESRQRIPET